MVQLGDALRAIGLSIPLCLRHDLGVGVAAALAHVAPVTLNEHLLEVLIWLPILGGFLILGLGDRPPAARWASLIVSIVTFGFSIPLWAGFRTGTAEMQFA